MLATATVKIGAEAWADVDYELIPGEREAPDCPATPDDAAIVRVRIGGQVIDDPDSTFSESLLEDWRSAILNH